MQRRRRLRLEDFDYSRGGGYVVTVCASDRRPIFGEQNGDLVVLTKMGRFVEDRLHAIPDHHPGVRLDETIVMPDHLHAILFLPGDAATLGTIVGAFKASVSRLSGRQDLWQRGFYDHVIRDEDDLYRIREYIRGNPYRPSRGG